MEKIAKNYSKYESILFNILTGMFVVNVLTLSLIILSDGDITIWLMALVLPAGIFFIVGFFVFIYLLVVYNLNKLGPDVRIWKTVTGLLLSPIGLLFSFFNYMIIVLANIW